MEREKIERECQSPHKCGVAWLDAEVGYISDLCESCQENKEDIEYAQQCADEKWRSRS